MRARQMDRAMMTAGNNRLTKGLKQGVLRGIRRDPREPAGTTEANCFSDGKDQ